MRSAIRGTNELGAQSVRPRLDGHCRHDVVGRRQEGDVGDLESCLLEDLSGGAGLEGFTILEMAAGKCICAYVKQ